MADHISWHCWMGADVDDTINDIIKNNLRVYLDFEGIHGSFLFDY